jgi:microsomal dipeptidase-like Zn-dependent dipeptidase
MPIRALALCLCLSAPATVAQQLKLQLSPANRAALAQAMQQKPVEGFADLHLHQMTDLGFGGRYLWGKHDGPIAQAVPHCSGMGVDHGFMTGSEGGDGNLGTHAKDGYPQFHGWPRWSSTSNQQAHADWLKKAHEHGLKLIVMSALNQDLFCEMIPKPLRDPHAPCDDFHAVVNELKAAHEFAKKHDWYVIARTPQQARAAIAQGKLAVVLAVEAGNALGEGKDWKNRLRVLHDLGVRSFQPVHEIDNRFSGAAWHAMPLKLLETIRNLETLDKKIERWVQTAFDIIEKSIGKHPDRIPEQEAAAAKKFANGIFGFDLDAHKLNKKGLSHEGHEQLEELFKEQILIDVSHMSQKALREAHAFSQKHGNYPIFISHGHIKELLAPGDQTEWTYPAELYDLVASTGGVVGLRSSPDEMRTVRGAPVANDCHGSTRSFAQKLHFADKLMGLQVAFGSDLNGFAFNLRPRHGGGDACGSGPFDEETKAQQARQQHAPRLGTAFDLKGFAHIGLLPDVLRDLEAQGASTQALRASAEAFLRMWERALDPHRPPAQHKAAAHAALSHLEPYPRDVAHRLSALQH